MRKYDVEFKQQAVKKILDGQSVVSVARELGVAEKLIAQLEKGARYAQIQSGAREFGTEETSQRSRDGARHLKKGGTDLQQRKLKRYQFVAAEAANYPIKVLCRMMQVSTSGYYTWRKRLTVPPKMKRIQAAQLVKNCFEENLRRYGSRRIQAGLQKSGEQIGRFQVRQLMREQNLRAIQPKKFVPQTTNSRRDDCLAEFAQRTQDS